MQIHTADLRSDPLASLKTSLPFLVFPVAILANKAIESRLPIAWGIIPVGIAIYLSRAKFPGSFNPVILLWKWLGALSALYALLHYPLMPATAGAGTYWYAALLSAWLLALLAGVACFRNAAWAILPPAFLYWSNAVAQQVTGLHITNDLDIIPLIEVSVCIGVGLTIASALKPDQRTTSAFATLLFLLALSIHLANYFWSGYIKVRLDHGPGLYGPWIAHNNPANLFVTALDDDHIFFASLKPIVTLFHDLVTATHRLTNIAVVLLQLSAIAAFIMPKRALLVMLILFDVMHISIGVLAGAHFWPWIILNLIIAGVVSRHDFSRLTLQFRIIGTLFIVIAPLFFFVAKLGWFDSTINNKRYFEAIDKNGAIYSVPTDFFTFYSYSFGHMDYGPPQDVLEADVGSPNGGAFTWNAVETGRLCRADMLVSVKAQPSIANLPGFVRDYHEMATRIEAAIGGFPFWLYPHHFYVPWSAYRPFSGLKLADIAYFVYKQETVCLSFRDGTLHRDVIASSSLKIDLNPD